MDYRIKWTAEARAAVREWAITWRGKRPSGLRANSCSGL